MAKLNKQTVKCTCGENIYNVTTSGDPLEACLSFKEAKCPSGYSVSVEVIETSLASSLLKSAISDSNVAYSSTKGDATPKNISGGYCVCRCEHNSATFKVYNCRQDGQSGPVCGQCCQNACANAGEANYELTTELEDVKNSSFVGKTILESGPDYAVVARSNRSILIQSNNIKTLMKIAGERLSLSDEKVFKAATRALTSYPSLLKSTNGKDISFDNIDVIGYDTPIDLGDTGGSGGGGGGLGGGCKDCGGGGGVLKRCVAGLGAAICIEVDPDIDIDWGSGNVGFGGGTITITINF